MYCFRSSLIRYPVIALSKTSFLPQYAFPIFSVSNIRMHIETREHFLLIQSSNSVICIYFNTYSKTLFVIKDFLIYQMNIRINDSNLP